MYWNSIMLSDTQLTINGYNNWKVNFISYFCLNGRRMECDFTFTEFLESPHSV